MTVNQKNLKRVFTQLFSVDIFSLPDFYCSFARFKFLLKVTLHLLVQDLVYYHQRKDNFNKKTALKHVRPIIWIFQGFNDFISS